MTGRLDRSRPLWDLELLPAIGEGQSAIVWRVHHAMADGVKMMHWASALPWEAARLGAAPPQSRGTAKGAEPTAPTPLLSTVAATARTVLSVGRELRPA